MYRSAKQICVTSIRTFFDFPFFRMQCNKICHRSQGTPPMRPNKRKCPYEEINDRAKVGCRTPGRW